MGWDGMWDVGCGMWGGMECGTGRDLIVFGVGLDLRCDMGSRMLDRMWDRKGWDVIWDRMTTRNTGRFIERLNTLLACKIYIITIYKSITSLN